MLKAYAYIFVITIAHVSNPIDSWANELRLKNSGAIYDSNLAARDIRINNYSYNMSGKFRSIEPTMPNVWINRFQRGDIEYAQMISGLYGNKFLLRAKAHILGRKFDEAEQDLDKYFNEQIASLDDKVQLARIYYCKGAINELGYRYSKAQSLYYDADKLDKSVTVYRKAIAKIKFLQGDFDAALNITKDVIDEDSKLYSTNSVRLADSYVSLAWIYYFKHDYKLAEEYAIKSLEIYDLVDLLNDHNRMSALLLAGNLTTDPNMTVRYYKKILECNEDNKSVREIKYFVLVYMAQNNIHSGKLDVAKKELGVIKALLNRILKLNPDNSLLLKYQYYDLKLALARKTNANMLDLYDLLNKTRTLLEPIVASMPDQEAYLLKYMDLAQTMSLIDFEDASDMINKSGYFVSMVTDDKHVKMVYDRFALLLHSTYDIYDSITFSKKYVDSLDIANKQEVLIGNLHLAISAYQSGEFESVKGFVDKFSSEDAVDSLNDIQHRVFLYDLIHFYNLSSQTLELNKLTKKLDGMAWGKDILLYAKKIQLTNCTMMTDEVCKDDDALSSDEFFKIYGVNDGIEHDLNRFKKYLVSGNKKRSMQLLQMIIRKVEGIHNDVLTSRVLYLVANIYKDCNDRENAMLYYNRVIEGRRQLYVTKAYLDIIDMIGRNANTVLVGKYINDSIKYFEDNDNSVLYIPLLRLADKCSDIKNYNASIWFLLKAKGILDKYIGSQGLYGIRLYERLGDAYYGLGDREATNWYDRSINISTKAFGSKKFELSKLYTKLGDAYLKIDKKQSAIDSYKSALDICSMYSECNNSDLKLKISKTVN